MSEAKIRGRPDASEQRGGEYRYMRTHELWHDRETGEIWAVELLDGVVAGAAGPLRPGNVSRAVLKHFGYDRREAARIEMTRSRFDLLDEQALLLLGDD